MRQHLLVRVSDDSFLLFVGIIIMSSHSMCPIHCAVDDEAGDDEDDPDDFGSDLDRDDHTFVVDDDGSPSKKLSQRKRKSVHFVETGGRSKRVVAPRYQPQGPIQPGSTSTVLGRRYLAYNNLGCIISRAESDHNIVDVVFHDTSEYRRRFSPLSDYFGFTMGSLSKNGALYASPSSENAPSTIVYRPFESWSANSDWTISLDSSEDAVSIAAGTSCCVVGTSARMVRLFTTTGLQTSVMAMPGDVVAVFAQDTYFGVVYHASPADNGDQNLKVSTYDFESAQKLTDAAVSLSPSSNLAWVGFSEEKALATCDSKGILRAFNPEFGGTWTPIFDSAVERKGSEIFWIFSLSLEQNEVRCIICADSEEPIVPSGSARPVITAPKLHVPVTMQQDDVSQLEGEWLRHRLLLSQISGNDTDGPSKEDCERNTDAVALRLFKALCEQQKGSKALDVACRLNSVKSLNGARRLANHLRMVALAGFIDELIQCMEEQERTNMVELPPLGAGYDFDSLPPSLPDGYGEGQYKPEESQPIGDVVHENGEPNKRIEAGYQTKEYTKVEGKPNPFARRKKT